MKWGRGTQWRPPLSEGIEQMKELVTCRGWSHATLREYISVDLSLRVRGDLSQQPWEPEQCSRILCYTAPSRDTERPLSPGSRWSPCAKLQPSRAAESPRVSGGGLGFQAPEKMGGLQKQYVLSMELRISLSLCDPLITDTTTNAPLT